MNEFLIGLSVTMFFLLPYYLTLLTAVRRLRRWHVSLWLGLHLVFTLVFGIRNHSLWNSPLILFCASLLYFSSTYFFYLRALDTQEDPGILQALLQRRSTRLLLLLLLGISALLLLADWKHLLHAGTTAPPEADLAYLGGVILFAFLENAILVAALLRQNKSKR